MDPLSFVSSIKPRLVRRTNYTNDNDKQFETLNDFEKSYFYRVHLQWNKLPLYIRLIENHETFLNSLKKHLWSVLMETPD